MPRVKRGVRANKRRKKVIKAAKGYQGNRSTKFKAANQAQLKAGTYAYRDRKVRKRDFRRLWIVRLNAAVREEGMSYSTFIAALKKNKVDLDRKILADIAFTSPETFKKIVDEVKS
ncbi:50S ribosomal protein L20 [Patescibacteria group bacterium]|nr:50S ribosomal protein L20 [Patescibacteria group bacterium]